MRQKTKIALLICLFCLSAFLVFGCSDGWDGMDRTGDAWQTRTTETTDNPYGQEIEQHERR